MAHQIFLDQVMVHTQSLVDSRYLGLYEMCWEIPWSRLGLSFGNKQLESTMTASVQLQASSPTAPQLCDTANFREYGVLAD